MTIRNRAVFALCLSFSLSLSLSVFVGSSASAWIRLPAQLSVSAFGGATAASPASSTSPTAAETRSLSFFHTHTDAEIDICYWRDGTYVETSLSRLDGFLSDFRTGEATRIDPALFDLLHEIARETGTREPFQVISCYRCPKTNAALRSKSSAVAEKSLHMEGRAIDIRLADVSSTVLRDTAIRLGKGGVGYYRKSDFVHVDTGRVRQW